jgi:hypothetical protein
MLATLLLSRARSFRDPITYEQYAVTVGTFRYDFSNVTAARALLNTTIGDLQFTVRIFDYIHQNENPWGNFSGVYSNALRCNRNFTSRQCREIATVYDWQWRPHETDPRWGISYESNGDPITITSGVYEDWGAAVEFHCNPSGTDTPTFALDTTGENPYLYIRFDSPWSCPTPVAQSPTPTPIVSPRCYPVFRPNGTSFGVAADLNELNHGRFGYGQMFADTDEIKYVFWQPCDAIVPCPWGATCNTDSPTSVWVCRMNMSDPDAALQSCNAHGVLPSRPQYTLINQSDIQAGFYYDLDAQGGNTARINLRCASTYPPGHVQIDMIRSRLNGSQFNFYGSAREVCARDIPDPQPVRGCNINVSQGNYYMDINLDVYTGVTPWNQSVSRLWPPGDFDLLYSPCKGILCPDGYDCRGESDGTVYLCDKQRLCTAYGIPDYNVSYTVRGDSIFYGAIFHYRAHNNRWASVTYLCDASLADGMLRFDTSVAVEGEQLLVTVYANEACARGSGPTPTPFPRVIPEQPVPTAQPSPLPNPWSRLMLWTFSDYIMVDLNRSQGVPLVIEAQDLEIGGRWGTIRTEFSPWIEIPPPAGWEVPTGGLPRANLWECWDNQTMTPYCHPVGSVRVPFWTATAVDEFDLWKGITLSYEGLWRSHARITAVCDPYASDWEFHLQDTAVHYSPDSTAGGPEYRFSVRSRTACPQSLVDPTVPTAPRPPPPSGAPQVTAITGPFGLRLARLATTAVIELVGHADTWHMASVHFSPLDRVGCPDGRDCGAYGKDKANLWKCVKKDFGACYPVGDRAYGLNMSYVDADQSKGIDVEYDGGAEGAKAVIQFTCDPTLKLWEMRWSGVTDEWDGRLRFSVYTAEVCRATEWGILTGGSVFLFVVYGLVMLYFGVGTAIKWLVTGYVEVPNDGFWKEVWASLTGVVKFIFTCGKEKPARYLYDTV